MNTPSYFSRSIVATWLATLSFIVILVGGWLHEKASAEARMRGNVVIMAQIAADRLSLTFDSISKTLLMIGDMVIAMKIDPAQGFSQESALAVQTMLIRARGANPSMVSLTATDAAGRTIAAVPFHAGNRPGELRRQDVSPPPKTLTSQPSISTPFKSPNSTAWRVRLTQRVEYADGTTAGYLIADIALQDALAQFFGHYPLTEGDFVSLHDTGHQQLAAFPESTGARDEALNDALGRNISEEDSPFEVRTHVSEINQTTHLVASHRLAQYPFHVLYGANVNAWLKTVRQEQLILALTLVAALIVTAAIAAGIRRRLLIAGQLHKLRDDLEISNVSLRAALGTAEQLAAHDQLTGLSNRRSFDLQLAKAIARAVRQGETFSLLMIDLDHFKQVNDYYGHATGDQVLKKLAQALRERLRQNDLAARWGGEEFVILADGTPLDDARKLADDIRETISSTPFTPVARITVSIGVAELQPGESGDDLLRRADRALYSAKRNGRNRVISAENSEPRQRLAT